MIVAYIPLRLNSSRIYQKNFSICGGKSLYEWIFEKLLFLKRKNFFSKIYVDYDNKNILNLVKKEYKNEFIFFKRELDLIKKDTTIIPLLESFINKYNLENEVIFQTHVTNPLLSQDTIKSSINYYMKNKIESLASVTAIKKRFYTHNGSPINHNPKELIQTQDLIPILEENSCIYIFKGSEFLKTRNRINEKTNLFEINPIEALDIDDDFELKIADSILKH